MRFKDKYGYDAKEHGNVLQGIIAKANDETLKNNTYRERAGKDVTRVRMAWPFMVKA